MSSTQFCHPSSDSDVPGNEFLCWKDGTNTWFPRQRYVMSNSSTKWPTNSILSSAVQPSPPIIIDAILNGNVVTLIWDYNENCLPANSFSIFQNGIFVKSVSKNVFKIDIAIDSCTTYKYYIVAVTNGSNISSEPSNEISITVPVSNKPDNIRVIWCASDVDNEIMCMNITFENPENIICGDPIEFVVSVLNENLNQISYQNITYVDSNNKYDIIFNNIPYSKYGEVQIYLKINKNNEILNGETGTRPYLSDPLPIFLNKILGQSESQLGQSDSYSKLSFFTISLSPLDIECVYAYNENGQRKIQYWQSIDKSSPNLNVKTTNISTGINDVPIYKTQVSMDSSFFNLDNFIAVDIVLCKGLDKITSKFFLTNSFNNKLSCRSPLSFNLMSDCP
jgi:hypothetical protein